MALIAMHIRAHALTPRLAALLATGLMCACAVAPVHAPPDLPPLGSHNVPDIEIAELSAVSEEMQDFLANYVPRSMNIGKRAWTLAYLGADPHILGFRYNPSLTLTPAETFRQRTGNCLSFSLMLVAMARHVGVPARFEEAVLEPEYRTVNDTFINSRHITVLLGHGPHTYLVDVSGEVFGDDVRTRRIHDRDAAAQYYNNLGVDALLENDLPLAWAHFRQALETDPRQAFLWSNLGVVYNRSGQVNDAEWAYQTALSVDRRESIAANNLYVIYQQQGRPDEAARLEDRVRRHRMRNPYYLALLATEALQSEQYDDAIQLLRRSIKINGAEYRFHGALAQAHYLAGEHEEALSSLDMARSLAPPAAAAELESLPLRTLPD